MVYVTIDFRACPNYRKAPFSCHSVTVLFCDENTSTSYCKLKSHCVDNPRGIQTCNSDRISALMFHGFDLEHCTWIFCKLDEASLTFWGTSKHLAVLILALTNHCWNSLKAERNPCSSSFSLLWHSLDAWRLRLETSQEEKNIFLHSTCIIVIQFRDLDIFLLI